MIPEDKLTIHAQENNIYDTTTKLGKSLINHGKYSNRIYLMQLDKDDYPGIISQLNDLAEQHNYSKIFVEVPLYAREGFSKAGYRLEAAVPRFFYGKNYGYFMSKFINEKRSVINNVQRIKKVLKISKGKTKRTRPIRISQEFDFRLCKKSDAEEMAHLYRTVFETYPFPIHEPEFIKKNMDRNYKYYCISENNKIVALASAEIFYGFKNAEMTDFATHPDYRGNGFALSLLYKLEQAMKEDGILTLFSIARALSFGMNITFAKMGYKYGGTLVNNTNIFGKLETMNVWYKHV